MVRHNNVIPNQHFHKTLWQDHVKTWFDQAARKKRRRLARAKKAAAVAPRPVGLLRPAVHPPTIKYNYKLRQGRGFTFAELKEAGIKKKEALGIGIAFDHRRRNRSAESLQLNAQRLKEYKAALILFPKKRGKPKAGDSGKEELSAAQQVTSKTVLPMPAVEKGEEAMVITDEMKEESVFHKLRVARSDYRMYGIRQRNRCAHLPAPWRVAAPMPLRRLRVRRCNMHFPPVIVPSVTPSLRPPPSQADCGDEGVSRVGAQCYWQLCKRSLPRWRRHGGLLVAG
jgi:large subunit ribosomal protein L13e